MIVALLCNNLKITLKTKIKSGLMIACFAFNNFRNRELRLIMQVERREDADYAIFGILLLIIST